MLRKRQPRNKSETYLSFIRSLPCCICHNDIQSEACHVRYADVSVGKPDTGLGRKPDDMGWTVPMCNKHHSMQHHTDERGFWRQQGIDPLRKGLALFRSFYVDDYAIAEYIIYSERGAML